ncbi:galactose oxidase early set domain-containing protein [Variovorax sp. PAMC 28711]|uniref:galactose oxidase early set domain-containing protein n=1 Tax=Variovorax sp. PAMC 28711 TaxID=1795631 RepID=UPI0009EAF21E|nr:galactose oxidase early set domain-containing protein [Variovorax sp. PAMC 28711]
MFQAHVSWARLARRHVSTVSLSASAVLLAACGGGGGSGGGAVGLPTSGADAGATVTAQSAAGNAAATPAAQSAPGVQAQLTLTPEEVKERLRDAESARIRDMETDTPGVPKRYAEVAEVADIAKSEALVAKAAALPPDAGTRGSWSAPIAWPIIAIHAVLAPNGKVMTYGTNQAGAQTAQLVYDVWDPVTKIHTLLPNTTGSDIFCNSQLVLPVSGQVLLAGGDIRGQKVPNGSGGILVNRGIRDVNLFDATTQTMVAAGMPMNYARWYDTLTTLPDGRVMVMGGYDADGRSVPQTEVYNGVGPGWVEMTNARYPNGAAYPRSYVAPSGKVIAFSSAQLHELDPNGAGALRVLPQTLPVATDWTLPHAMYDRGKVLVGGADGTAAVLDINGAAPVSRVVDGIGPTHQIWATMTVLADGQVLNTGGSPSANAAPNAGYTADIWNPRTEKWTIGASAVNYRLYHSTALLLPDATVLVAGGGAPGPAIQLNAEIFSPPYLFAKDGSGQRLPRPSILSAPKDLALGTPYRMSVVSQKPIQRVNLVRTGSVTHSINFDQRFLNVPFTQSGSSVTLNVDETNNVLPPGHYMVFAIDSDGVPSIAKIVRIGVRAA